jgi:hypothetical protein
VAPKPGREIGEPPTTVAVTWRQGCFGGGVPLGRTGHPAGLDVGMHRLHPYACQGAFSLLVDAWSTSGHGKDELKDAEVMAGPRFYPKTARPWIGPGRSPWLLLLPWPGVIGKAEHCRVSGDGGAAEPESS